MAITKLTKSDLVVPRADVIFNIKPTKVWGDNKAAQDMREERKDKDKA